MYAYLSITKKNDIFNLLFLYSCLMANILNIAFENTGKSSSNKFKNDY